MSDDTKKEEVKPREKEVVKLPVVEKKVAPKKVAPKKRKAAPARPAKPVKRYSFDQWAARSGVKEHHRKGLRAFIKNSKKHRTLAEWDACFKGY